VWLPAGEWIGYFDGKTYTGGLHTAETEKIPVYYRKGEAPEEAPVTQYLPFDPS
jgi:alpha-glucosidase (family GH31 glycosyl hydrolase)